MFLFLSFGLFPSNVGTPPLPHSPGDGLWVAPTRCHPSNMREMDTCGRGESGRRAEGRWGVLSAALCPPTSWHRASCCPCRGSFCPSLPVSPSCRGAAPQVLVGRTWKLARSVRALPGTQGPST